MYTMGSADILQRLCSGATLREVADEIGITYQGVSYRLTAEDRAAWAQHRKQVKKERALAAQAKVAKRKARRWANKPKDRFWESVNIGADGDCWEWQLARFPSGYGHLQWGRKDTYAHRLAWELNNGPIPEGMCACHKCDNPSCCNPSHLFLGTQQENILDAVDKGRWGNRRKLTMNQARDIRERCIAYGDQARLANEYGVSYGVINSIVHNKTYTYLEI